MTETGTPFTPVDPVTEPSLVDLPEWWTVVARYDETTLDDLQTIADTAFGAVVSVLDRYSLRPAGAAFFKFESDPMQPPFALEVGFPVENTIDEPIRSGDVLVVPSSLPAGRAVMLSHIGSYDAIVESWERLVKWAIGNELPIADGSWEVYVTEPSAEADPMTMRTDLVVPLTE